MDVQTALIKPHLNGVRVLILLHGELTCRKSFSQSSDHDVLPLYSQFADFPDPMLYSDYLPELSRNDALSCSADPDLGAEEVSWEDLVDMDLPSFRPAFLVLCRVLLNVIHECLKLRLEQRPAGEPSLLSIKQASGPTAKANLCRRSLSVLLCGLTRCI